MKNIFYNMKTNLLGAIIIIAALILIIFLALPSEKEINNELSIKYSEMAQNYNTNKDDYKDIQTAIKTKREISDLESVAKISKLLTTSAISLMLIGLTGLLATLLQYIFTKIKFTRKDFEGEDGIYDDEERKNKMIVLASALLSSTIIVSSVFIVIFLQ